MIYRSALNMEVELGNEVRDIDFKGDTTEFLRLGLTTKIAAGNLKALKYIIIGRFDAHRVLKLKWRHRRNIPGIYSEGGYFGVM